MDTETEALLIAQVEKLTRHVVDLRKRVTALENTLASSTGSPVAHPLPVNWKPAVQPLPVPFTPPGTTGNYVPSSQCITCGAYKGATRTALTCKACGVKRNAIIRDKSLTRPVYATCHNCGTSKGGNMQPLCNPCSASFREWKADQQ